MWIWQFWLDNDKEHKEFYTDTSTMPEEAKVFREENKDRINDIFVDHFPCTVKEFEK